MKIELSNFAKKFLKKNTKVVSKRIIERIEKLSENPFPQNCKRIQGRKEKTFRVRVGDYRTLYVIFKEKNKLLISEIEKRERAYNQNDK